MTPGLRRAPNGSMATRSFRTGPLASSQRVRGKLEGGRNYANWARSGGSQPLAGHGACAPKSRLLYAAKRVALPKAGEEQGVEAGRRLSTYVERPFVRAAKCGSLGVGFLPISRSGQSSKASGTNAESQRRFSDSAEVGGSWAKHITRPSAPSPQTRPLRAFASTSSSDPTTQSLALRCSAVTESPTLRTGVLTSP